MRDKEDVSEKKQKNSEKLYTTWLVGDEGNADGMRRKTNDSIYRYS